MSHAEIVLLLLIPGAFGAAWTVWLILERQTKDGRAIARMNEDLKVAVTRPELKNLRVKLDELARAGGGLIPNDKIPAQLTVGHISDFKAVRESRERPKPHVATPFEQAIEEIK